MREFLVVDRVYRGFIVVFSSRMTQANLILLDMLNFNVNLGINWLPAHHVILNHYVKTMTLAYLGLP